MTNQLLASFNQLAYPLSAELLQLESQRKRAEISDLFKLIERFNVLTQKLYQIRANASQFSSPELQTVEDLMASISQQMSFARKAEREVGIIRSWVRRYRAIWQREKSLFYFCLSFFVAATVIGWILAVKDQDLLSLILGQRFMEAVIENEAWFEKIQENPLGAGLSIAYNNIVVSFNCFLLGSLLGLGGIYILVFNALLLGGLFGYCYLNDFDTALSNFVISHGFLELSIIIASCFAGLLYGRTFYQRPWRDFPARFRQGARDALIVIGGILPWLILAACLEVYVSPFTFFSFPQKLLLGIIAGALFWLWTFPPAFLRREDQD